MRGRGLSKHLQGLKLRSRTPSPERESLERSHMTKSPSKSPSKMTGKTGTSKKPYDLHPSASGPGGLLSMLKTLREMRDQNSVRGKSTTSAERKEDQVSKEETTNMDCQAPLSSAEISAFIDDTFMSYPAKSRHGPNSLATDKNKTNHKSRSDKCQSNMEAFSEATDLEKKIIRQVEYYFGDYNLPKDKWMLEKLEECDEGWFDMETMMTFKRLSSLTQDPSVVLMALAKSSNDLLQVENWGHGKGRVRRNPKLPLPRLNEARKVSIQERTLFIWGFEKSTTSLDDLIEYFEGSFRNVVNIRQRTMAVRGRGEEAGDEKDEEEATKREFMGSVFVTFASRSDAEEVLRNRHHQLIFKGKKLKAKWQREFNQDKAEFNDEFDADNIERTIYVSGFDKLETTKEELLRFFQRFQGPIALRKRVFRFGSSDSEWQFTGGVFVTFDIRDNAKEFIEVFGDNLTYQGDALRVKWQAQFFRENGKFQQQLKGTP